MKLDDKNLNQKWSDYNNARGSQAIEKKQVSY